MVLASVYGLMVGHPGLVFQRDKKLGILGRASDSAGSEETGSSGQQGHDSEFQTQEKK